MNPIFAREWKARWREKRSFWLLLGLVLLLALLAGWVYYTATGTSLDRNPYVYNPMTGGYTRASEHESLLAMASRTGRSLFQALALGNCFACLFLAPALAAPGIARERERGLIESLQLSPMRAGGQIVARFLSALVFLLVLQIATFPVYGIILFLGGVSPGEMSKAALLIGVSILLGAAIGIWCSARSYRPSSALFTALVGLGLWSLVAWVTASDNSSLLYTTNAWAWGRFWLDCLHPAVLLQYLIHPETFLGQQSIAGSTLVVDANAKLALPILLAVTLVLVPTLLWFSSLKVNKPLPLAQWKGRNREVEKWKAQLQAEREQARARREETRLSHQVQGALVADLPLDKFVRFRNPVLAREVKGRFRLRRGNWLVSLFRAAAFLIGVVMWIFVLVTVFDAPSRPTVPYFLTGSLWVLGGLTACVLASSSFTRERESGTWEGLRLALLHPGEIVRAKWQSVLVSFAYYSAPLWIFFPLAISWNDPIQLQFVGMQMLLALASIGAFCAFGLWVSWRSPHPTAALSWTLGVAFALVIAWPIVESIGDMEKQFSFAAYGVAPLGSSDYDPNIEARESQNYRSERGMAELLSIPRPTDFYAWRDERRRRAHVTWQWLHCWQPVQVVTLLDPSLKSRTDTNYSYYHQETDPSELDRQMQWPLAWTHFGLSLAVALVSLGLVSRGIARQHE